MNRRAFLGAFGFLAVPLAAEAQQATRPHRIGVLAPYLAADPVADKLRPALRDVGYEEGRTVAIEWRQAGDDAARLLAAAAELARLDLAVIIAIGDRAIRAARDATTTTPIIAGSDDLVGEGHAGSLARPGGRVTGVSILAAELNAKRLETLKAAVPAASRVAVLWESGHRNVPPPFPRGRGPEAQGSGAPRGGSPFGRSQPCVRFRTRVARGRPQRPRLAGPPFATAVDH